MGLDRRTVVLYGWKVSGNKKVSKLTRKLEEWDEDYYDKLDSLYVEDTMCGNYLYFGTILVYYDSDELYSEIITKKLINDSTKKWNDFIKENPEVDNIFKEYKKGDPQLYVFSHIW